MAPSKKSEVKIRAMSKKEEKAMRVLIFRRDEWWVAQCLEYDIAAQARSLNDVQYEIQRVVIGRVFAAQALGIEPFKGIPKAPEGYHKIFKKPDATLKVEFRPFKKVPAKIPAAYIPKEAQLVA
jgi:hypothetical protein